MLSLILLCKFATTINNMIYTFISFLTQSTFRVFLTFVNLCFKQVCSYTLILCCNYQTFCLPLQVSILKLNPTCSFLTSLVCQVFYSQCCSLIFFFAFYKTLVASKPFTPSSLAACSSLSSLP